MDLQLNIENEEETNLAPKGQTHLIQGESLR